MSVVMPETVAPESKKQSLCVFGDVVNYFGAHVVVIAAFENRRDILTPFPVVAISKHDAIHGALWRKLGRPSSQSGYLNACAYGKDFWFMDGRYAAVQRTGERLDFGIDRDLFHLLKASLMAGAVIDEGERTVTGHAMSYADNLLSVDLMCQCAKGVHRSTVPLLELAEAPQRIVTPSGISVVFPHAGVS